MIPYVVFSCNAADIYQCQMYTNLKALSRWTKFWCFGHARVCNPWVRRMWHVPNHGTTEHMTGVTSAKILSVRRIKAAGRYESSLDVIIASPVYLLMLLTIARTAGRKAPVRSHDSPTCAVLSAYTSVD